jgi:hypothetical protein
MLHTVDLDEENRVAIVRYQGLVRAHHAVPIIRAMIALPGWTPEYSRIIVYDKGQLGEMDDRDLLSQIDELKTLVVEAYEGRPHVSAHVCADPMKAPIVDYWLHMSAGRGYAVPGNRFDSIVAALRWIEEQRKLGKA